MFLNLKILRLEMDWIDVLGLLCLLHTPTLRLLDIDFGRMPYFFYIERLFDRISRLKLPLLALRISQFDNADGLDRFFESPAIQTIPLVEVIIPHRFPGPEFQRQRIYTFGGGAARVEHWILGEFVGWNRLSDVPRDLADYLAGNVLLQCCRAFSPFKFIVFETMKKADNGVPESRSSNWNFLDFWDKQDFWGRRNQDNSWDEEDF